MKRRQATKEEVQKAKEFISLISPLGSNGQIFRSIIFSSNNVIDWEDVIEKIKIFAPETTLNK